MTEKNHSLWGHEKETPDFPVLSGIHQADVAVVGAGITGLTTAMLLKEAGLKVAVVEAEKVCYGTTGHTTAKITALHRLIYARLESDFGKRTAGLFADANLEAIDQIERFVRQFEIDCDFTRLPAYTYTCRSDMIGGLEKETEAAKRAGLEARLVRETDLPFRVEAAVRLDGQARFHPARYCAALARNIDGEGSRIFQGSRVKEVTERGIRTSGGEIEADHVVLATLLPFLDRGALFIHNYPWRSYLLAARPEGPLPAGMYISAEEPVRSITPAADGSWLLIGGESHKSGQDPDTRDRYQALKTWARDHFALNRIEYEWSSQDYMPADGLPYIGHLHPFTKKIFVATGFGKWGLTRGTFAAMIIRDMILGLESPWKETFRTSRLSFTRSPVRFFSENLNVGRHFVQDRVEAYRIKTEPPLEPDQGRVIRQGKKTAAVYRTPEGEYKAVSPVCTHLGCYVTWNTAERTWDCPCHGSRFDVDGGIVNGPALKKLVRDDDEGHSGE